MHTRLLLIDGKNFCWRHGWTRRGLRTSEKFPTGVLFGALSGMLRLKKHFPEHNLVFCWEGGKTWREEIYPDYKGHRKKGNVPQEVKDVHVQIPVLRELLSAMKIPQVEGKGLEADDVIGILSKRMKEVLIYSSDKDFFQLMGDRVQVVRDIDKGEKCKPLSERQVVNKFGVVPKDWIRFKCLVGDPSDNIQKPFKRMGLKGAQEILARAEYDPSQAECPCDDLKEEWEAIRLNYKLVKIVRTSKDNRLPAMVRKEAEKIEQIPYGELVRGEKSWQGYRNLLAFLVKYELESMIEKREEIWKL